MPEETQMSSGDAPGIELDPSLRRAPLAVRELRVESMSLPLLWNPPNRDARLYNTLAQRAYLTIMHVEVGCVLP